MTRYHVRFLVHPYNGHPARFFDESFDSALARAVYIISMSVYGALTEVVRQWEAL